MISTVYRCIFVRISKVASTSIQRAFMQKPTLLGAFKNRFIEKGEFDTIHHDLQHYQDSYPDNFDSYFKFTFVRNPWDRIYSQYNYLRYHLQHESSQCSFSDWLKKCSDAYEDPNGCLFGRNRHYFLRHIGNQLDWLIVNEEIAIDFIGRYESLARDFRDLCRDRKWKLDLPQVNGSKANKASYLDVYDDNGKNFVADLHSKDIEYFNYSFCNSDDV